MAKGYKIDGESARDLRKVIPLVLGQNPSQEKTSGESHARSIAWYWAKLTSDMTAGALDDPTTFTFTIWFPSLSASDSPVPFEETTDTDLQGITGVNRSSMEATEGVMIKVEFAFGEWTPKWVDC